MHRQPTYSVMTEGLGFPEGPVVMADGSVIVVELAVGRITRCWGDGRKETIAEPGGGPNGAAIGPDGALWVCNNGGVDLTTLQSARGTGHEGRIERINLSTGKIERVYDRWEMFPLSGPNDIVFDTEGNFWFTDLAKTYDNVHEMGGLFYAMADGSAIKAVHHGLVSYNGVAFSPDQKTLYVADTYTARLIAFDPDPNADPATRRLIGTVPGLVSVDSMAVTEAGNICLATLHHGAITTFTPAGDFTSVPFPDEYTTNIAFGGGDMRTAYITQSIGGKLLRMEWAEPGLKLNFNA